ncbi:hypothetical protein [Hydrogenophaga sp. R2]|uniref:hypothetical protein n=1 Tax=Hydrogenophaga sp. R2 TaxID=3132827 RepID=UPI003CF06F56
MKRSILLLSLLVSGAAFAKLPAPVLTDEAKAKAAEAAAKTAHGNKVAAYQLCKSMDKAAANHFKTTAGQGKSPTPGAPACVDPGPFVYTPAPAAPAAAAAPAAPAAPAAAPAKKS